MENRQDAKHADTKKELKALSKRLNQKTAKIRAGIKLYTGALDVDITSNRKRVKRIETHLGFASPA